MIENELSRYGGLEDRPRLVALNKIDVPDGRDLSDIVIDDLREQGLRVFPVSAASGDSWAISASMAPVATTVGSWQLPQKREAAKPFSRRNSSTDTR